jgi:MFS family permease
MLPQAKRRLEKRFNQKGATMLAVLRRRSFAMLWLGQLVSQIGDMVLIIALPFYVYQLTGSLLQTGLMYIVETLPRILLGSLAGVFVDRWDRRRIMIVSDLGRAVVLLLLLLVHSPDHLWLIYVVAGIQSVISLFFAPALSAITPALVDEHQLVAANSLQSVSESLMRFVGPPLGGALLALVGLAGVALVDSASFLLSALMLVSIGVPSRDRTAGPRADRIGALWVQVWREWLDGLRLVRARPTLTALFVTLGLFALAGGLAAAPLIAFVREVMGGTALTLGWMAMAQGAGSLLGAGLVGRAMTVVRPAYLVGVPLSAAGCIVLLFVNIPTLVVVLPLIALMGVLIVGFFVATQTLVQLNVDDQYRGRVASALGTTTALMGLFGMLIASALGDRAGPVSLLDGTASLNTLAGVVAMVLLRDARMQIRPVPTAVPIREASL